MFDVFVTSVVGGIRKLRQAQCGSINPPSYQFTPEPVSLSAANLIEAKLGGANLIEVSLGWADLSEAKLSKATVWNVDLSKASLRKANLSGAELDGADLSGADLTGATIVPEQIKTVKSLSRHNNARWIKTRINPSNGVREWLTYWAFTPFSSTKSEIGPRIYPLPFAVVS